MKGHKIENFQFKEMRGECITLFGWDFLCMVQGDGEPDMTRMYSCMISDHSERRLILITADYQYGIHEYCTEMWICSGQEKYSNSEKGY